jgi:hypothetical protein
MVNKPNAMRVTFSDRIEQDKVHAYSIPEDWYCYGDAALRAIAVAWCEAHDMPDTET